MGTDASGPLLTVPVAQQTFDLYWEAFHAVPPADRRTRAQLELLDSKILESLRRTPPKSREVSLHIHGDPIGPMFTQFLPDFRVPPCVTKLSLRKSGLRPDSGPRLVHFVLSCPWLKELDLSENDLGPSSRDLLLAVLGHKSLISLQLESCGVDVSCLRIVTHIVATTRVLQSMRIGPIIGTPTHFHGLVEAVEENRSLTDVFVSDQVGQSVRKSLARNSVVSEITDELLRATFPVVPRPTSRPARAFKSIKPRSRSYEQRAVELRMDDGRSPPRVGCADTIGRRSEMLGMSIVLENVPVQRALMVGIFDGHGGRDAVEFAAKNLPVEIAATGFPEAFEAVHRRMAATCWFCGTTVAIAVVRERVLTVAAVGDTRCVLCRGGGAVQLTCDHRPDVPSERQHIESHGGTIEDGRVNGVLDISRSLGDGILGECINPLPDVLDVELTPEDEFFIVACDGVWGVMTNEEAVALIRHEKNPEEAARKLRDAAFERDSIDNISVIVVIVH
jgi:serine/threonine protein phosphatase PrpC